MRNVLTAGATVLIAAGVAACGPIGAASAHPSHPVASTLEPSPVRTLKPSPTATRQAPTATLEPSTTVSALPVVPASTPPAVSAAPAPATTAPAPAPTTAVAPQRADVARLEQDGFPAQQVLPYEADNGIEGAAYGCNTDGVGQMVLLTGSDATAEREAELMASGPEDGEAVSYTNNLILVTDTCTGLSLIVAQDGWPVP